MKKNYRLNLLPPPTDHVRKEDMRDLLNQHPRPIILMENFNAHNTLWGCEKTSARWKMLEQILDELNLFCLNENEETYYRAYDGCKSTID